MKKWLGRLKERLGRLKPWLKQHWKIVLVVAVAVGVFLFVVLKKPGALAAAVNPPAGGATGGAAGGDTATTTGSGATSSAAGHGTSGGSLFDPPAPVVSRPAFVTSVAAPQPFTQTPRTVAESKASVAAVVKGYAAAKQPEKIRTILRNWDPAERFGGADFAPSGLPDLKGALSPPKRGAPPGSRKSTAALPSRPPVKPEPTPGVPGGGRFLGGHGAQ